MALMASWNVGLNVNTLPVISLGIGFGEDYGIYIVSRIIEEYQRQDRAELPSAVIEGMATARQGRALHRCPGFGRDCILVLITAAFSSRDGLPAFDYPDYEYAWRSPTATRAYRPSKTEVRFGIRKIVTSRTYGFSAGTVSLPSKGGEKTTKATVGSLAVLTK